MKYEKLYNNILVYDCYIIKYKAIFLLFMFAVKRELIFASNSPKMKL